MYNFMGISFTAREYMDKFQERHRLPHWHKKEEKVSSITYL